MKLVPHIRIGLALIMLAPTSSMATPVAAQQRDISRDTPRDVSRETTGALSILFDNDAIGLHATGAPPDYDYSSGLTLRVDHARAPRWMRAISHQTPGCDAPGAIQTGCIAVRYGLSHQIFTPRANADTVVPGERPYAGWMFGSFDASLLRPSHSRTFGIDVGATGPLALAEQVQNGLHRTFAHTSRLGWRDQLGDGVGVVLRYQEGFRLEGRRGRFVPAIDVRWAGAAGNIVTLVSGGVDASIGLGGSLPWRVVEPRVRNPTRFYFTAGVQQDGVLHSVFIDGRAGGPGARRRPWVGQFEGGLGIRYRRFSGSYRHIVRGREYEAQPNRHPYGSILLSLNRF